MTEINTNFVDPIITDQEWFVASFISPKYVKNTARVIETKGTEKPEIDMNVFTAFKFRGAFPTEEKARERAKFLQDTDPNFDIMIGNSFKWIIMDPDVNHINDIVYHEEKLNEIMFAHKNEIEKIKKIEIERRKSMLNETQKSVTVNDKPIDNVKINKNAVDINDIAKDKEKVIKSLEDNINELKKLIE